MAKKATNPRIQTQVSPELKEITVKHLDMTQAQFFEKYLSSLFIAIDKDNI